MSVTTAKRVFQSNISRVLRPSHLETEEPEEKNPKAKSYLKYFKRTTGKIGKVINKHRNESTFTFHKQINNTLVALKVLL